MSIEYRGHKIDLRIRKGNGHVRLWFCRIDKEHAFSAYGIDQPAEIQISKAKELIDAQEAQ
jgi:hypothetical protein